jgi:Carboxypeptidase regulatory-like domain
MQIRVLSAAAFWFATAAVALSSPRLTVTGKVVDSTGQPLSNATVMVYHAGVKIGYSTFCPSCYVGCGKRTRTDAAGSYTFTKLNSDLWFELLVVRDGYSPAFVKANDSSYGMAPTAILNLRTPITDPARVAKGRVIDGAGNAVPDAVVNSVGVEIDKGALIGTIPGLDPLAVTNDNGEFELVYAKPAKRMLLSVEARTLAPKFAVLATGPDRQTIELARGATIRGHLMQGGKPVGNAEIGLIGQARGGFGPQLTIVGTPYSELRVGTQEDGSFALSNVPVQTNWYVYAKMESVASRGATEPKVCATTRPEETVNVGDIHLRPGYRLEGKVLLSDGKSVPEGMRVIISSQRVWDSQTAILGRGGHFTFFSLPEGKYSISPAVRGYSLPDGQDEVETSVERNVNDFVITLNPNPPAH